MNKYDATPSVLGFLYQIRWALLEALRRLKTKGSLTVSIETLDDVSFDAEGGPVELLQTKHHLQRASDLTDSSEDIWKALRVWSDGAVLARWPDDALHYLVTTSEAAPGSAAELLRPIKERDPLAAKVRLDSVARTSGNQANRPAYSQYLSLSDAERLSLLGRLIVVDRAPVIGEVLDRLQEELAYAVVREKVPSLLTRLEGWWFQRVLSHLLAANREPIRSEEIDAELERLRQQFRDDNLPIDGDLLELEIDEKAFASRHFVAQLRLLDLRSKRLVTAMRNYYRAKEQRSRWLREGFLLVGELDRYDKRLCDDWDTRFEAMIQELGDEKAEVALKRAGRDLYAWAELEATIYIRLGCTEPFIPRGSLQMLADVTRVGWHPQFAERLQALAAEVS